MNGLKMNMKMAENRSFNCKIKKLDTSLLVFLNGEKPNFETIEIQKNVKLSFDETSNFFTIFVEKNTKVEKPIQIVSAIDFQDKIDLTQHFKIIIEQNSSLTILHCDDSLKSEQSNIHNFVEIILEKNAKLNYYKMENKDSGSTLTNRINVVQKANSNFYSNVITFNAGKVHNYLNVTLTEPFANAQLYGLYLVDKKQHIHNSVKVIHAATDCISKQLYKGIADENSVAIFNGHIFVEKDAQRTAAFQTNRNIALSDEAHIKTQPFLEIYADDVKCSHGATVGQLDENAMFYLRSRGICQRNARMLLMFAFANEVAQTVEIVALRERLSQMIQQRLKGELHICSQCALHCGENREMNFG